MASTTNIYFSVMEAGNSKIKVLAVLVFGEDPLSGLQTAAFHLYLTWPRERKDTREEGREEGESERICTFLFLSIRAPPHHDSSTLVTIYFPMAPSPNTNTLGIRVST